MHKRKRMLRRRAQEHQHAAGHQEEFQNRHRHRPIWWAAFTATFAVLAGLLSAVPAQAVTGYHVVVGSLGVNARSGPGTGYAAVGKLYNGQPIDIACQTKGSLVGVGLPGTPTDVWDRLTNGWYITDYYTSTPGLNGSYTPGIPQCGAVTPPPPPAPAPPPPPTVPQPPDGCAQVRVVGARGSGEAYEINPAQSKFGMGPTVDKFYSTLKGLLPGVDVRYWADPYPAVAVENFAHRPDYQRVPYLASVEYGELFASQYVAQHLRGCKSEHLVLVGFSQGADVMHGVWNKYAGNGGLDALRGRLDSVVLFADPHFDPSQVHEIPAYSLNIGSFTRSGHGGILGADPVVWTPQQQVNHFMHSYCRIGDAVCDAPWPYTNKVHTSYVKYGIPQGAAQSLSRWLIGHYFK